MEQGWIKLYRSIREHWIWEDPIKLKWWLDILLQANHQDKKILLGNSLFNIERGQFHTSELKLMERWKVGKKAVRSFLELLEKDGMISLEKSKKGTTIKVLNYKGFQGFSEEKETIKDTTEEPQRNHKETIRDTIEEPQGDHKGSTNNNDKECITMIKNEEEGKEGEENTPPTPPPNLSPIQEKILNSLGPVSYKTWIANTKIIDKEDTVTFTVANKFTKEAIESKFKQKLEISLGKQIEVKEE